MCWMLFIKMQNHGLDLKFGLLSEIALPRQEKYRNIYMYNIPKYFSVCIYIYICIVIMWKFTSFKADFTLLPYFSLMPKTKYTPAN